MSEIATHLAAGTQAPDFIVTDQAGNEVRLKDFLGKKIILFFYPQDDTETCNKEVSNLRDHYATLVEQGFVVLGVSPDDEKSHRKFIEKFELPYSLLADIGHDLIGKFGVWGEKTTFGKTYMGLHRTTYVIDERGVIAHVIYPVESVRHAEQILELYA